MKLDELKRAVRQSVDENGLDPTLDVLADLYHELGKNSKDGTVLFALSAANKILKKAR